MLKIHNDTVKRWQVTTPQEIVFHSIDADFQNIPYEQLKNLQFLTFKYCNIDKIPKNVLKFKCVRSLYIQNCVCFF